MNSLYWSGEHEVGRGGILIVFLYLALITTAEFPTPGNKSNDIVYMYLCLCVHVGAQHECIYDSLVCSTNCNTSWCSDLLRAEGPESLKRF